MTEQATVVVPLPLAIIEGQLWDVTTWSNFINDVQAVRRSSHERYVFTIGNVRHAQDVLVAVRWRARDHHFVWRALQGPTWQGELSLTALNGRRTRVQLSMEAQPRSTLGALVELFGSRHRDVRADLHRLQELMVKVPVPARPPRLETEGSRGLGSRATQAGLRSGPRGMLTEIPADSIRLEPVSVDVG